MFVSEKLEDAHDMRFVRPRGAMMAAPMEFVSNTRFCPPDFLDRPYKLHPYDYDTPLFRIIGTWIIYDLSTHTSGVT